MFAPDAGPTPETLLNFKKYCPNLERFVDKMEREWVYTPSGKNGCGFDARLECQLMRRELLPYHGSDLPTLE
ncbi:hypothetical protein M407DRAFT_135711 [Tulasnella calospora MUT 4182]|uniref:Uncharacterized protein n=1 Tax=Tulasnella calospora MUT 4182 TaxID=1051891 RepID=A0A0C3QT65_9AGAM|nr:hypothetical protein M407DRAFT_135711 [Tulasnella calospora MUT 4182]